jgi:hypothetical protein
MSNNHTYHVPLTNSRDAPRFGKSPTEFESYFEDVEEIGKRANLTTKETIKWAIRYAGNVGEGWKNVPCLRDPDNLPDFATFVKEVKSFYPEIDDKHRYTINDVERLVNNTRKHDDMTKEELGEYYRKFLTMTQYLIGLSRLSERERNKYYLNGFPVSIAEKIALRLTVKKPDVIPEEGYDFTDVHDCALFILSSNGLPFNNVQTPGIIKRSPSNQPPVKSNEESKIDRLYDVMMAMLQSNNGPSSSYQPPRQPPPHSNNVPLSTPGGVQNGPPRNASRPLDPMPDKCAFCGRLDHFIKKCVERENYHQAGKIDYNSQGRVVLPSGQYIPRHISGITLKERVDNFYTWKNQTDQPAQTNFVECIDERVFQVEIAPTKPRLRASLDAEEFDDDPDVVDAHIQELESQLALAVQNRRKQFDGVDPPRRGEPQRPHQPPPQSNDARSRPEPSPSTQEPRPAPNVVGKQGARAGAEQKSIERPQGPMKPLDLAPKPADESKQRYRSNVESSVDTTSVTERALNSTITLSTRELLAVSADVRKHVKDMITSKKVAVNVVETSPVDAYLTSTSKEASEAFLTLEPGEYNRMMGKNSKPSKALPTLPLRVIYPTFGDDVQAECILDSGSQIVVMRRDIWQRLDIPISSDKSTSLEAANSGTAQTLGLVENVPVKLGPVVVYLQAQVVSNAPFEVLLGRPFFDITNCMEISLPGGRHEIRVIDPSDGRPYVFSTKPRPFRCHHEDHPAVNFTQ